MQRPRGGIGIGISTPMKNEYGRALLITCMQTFLTKGKKLKAHT